jgi:hypothetical protein
MTSIRSLCLLLCLAIPLASLTACSCVEEPEEVPTPTPAPEVDHDRGYYLDMDMDSQGRVWLAYQDALDTGEALVASRGSGDPIEFEFWSVDGHGEVVNGILTGAYHAGNYASIAVDGSDRPHIAHWNRDADTLQYATLSGESFTTGLVAEGGRFASIGIKDGSTPIISFYDGGKLKVAVNDGSWGSEVVDEGTAPEVPEGEPAIDADVGQYSDLMVASSGTVYVAYYDAANGDLVVASGGPGAWTVETWASEGNVGAWPTLSEHAGEIWVAYQDLDNHDLVLGHRVGDTLETEIVDDGAFVGADSSIAWVGDTAAIMYHDGVNNDAKLAYNDGAGWVLSTHMADGAVGFFNTVMPAANGDLNWSCFNHTSTDFVFQRFSLPAAE